MTQATLLYRQTAQAGEQVLRPVDLFQIGWRLVIRTVSMVLILGALAEKYTRKKHLSKKEQDQISATKMKEIQG
jgi:hypothetical protein